MMLLIWKLFFIVYLKGLGYFGGNPEGLALFFGFVGVFETKSISFQEISFPNYFCFALEDIGVLSKLLFTSFYVYFVDTLRRLSV